jgi:glycylpeptide N-tetradecanoyltransferase
MASCTYRLNQIYTSGKVLPTPFTQAIYYHRSINPKKLIEIGFSGLPRTQTMAMNKKLYMLPEAPTLEGLRPMNKKDVPGLTKLINDGLS